MSDSRARLKGQLAWQAHQCRALGSPLYARLLSRAARDTEAGGIVWEILRARQRDPLSSALGLRFMAAIHRIVLDGRAEALAAHGLLLSLVAFSTSPSGLSTRSGSSSSERARG